MKKTRRNILVATTITLALSLITSSTMAAAKPQKGVLVKVNGLVCAFCAQGISKALKRNSSVESAKVNLKAGTVEVKYKPGKKMSLDDLEELIEDNGQEVTSMEMKKYAKKKRRLNVIK